MPAMNLRLVAPELIVDIGDLNELRGIAVRGGVVTIGALTRHADLLKSSDIAAHAPLLTNAVAHVGHPAIRNRGTMGGSLAHADPASELPACMVALNATIIARGPAGERRIPARDFFTGIYETALSVQELLVAVELPVAPKNSVHFFYEFARRHGDYAIVGLAAQAIVENDLLTDFRPVFFAVGDRPVLANAAAKLLRPRSRRRCCRKHRTIWAKNSIHPKISRQTARCAGIWRRCCWRGACPRFLAVPISVPGDLGDDTLVNLASRQRRAGRCAGPATA